MREFENSKSNMKDKQFQNNKGKNNYMNLKKMRKKIIIQHFLSLKIPNFIKINSKIIIKNNNKILLINNKIKKAKKE